MDVIWTSLQIVVPFLGGFVVGLYFEDYREDRDWCRNVDAVLNDIMTTTDEMRVEQTNRQGELRTAADRLDGLIDGTPTYRHGIRRQLEPLQEDLEHLSEVDQLGPQIGYYEHDDDPDDRGDLDRIDYIIDQADVIDDRVEAIDSRLNYGIFALLPRFLYHNLLPHRLRR